VRRIESLSGRLLPAAVILLAGCAKTPPVTVAVPDSTSPRIVRVTDTLTVRDPELEQQVNRLEMQLLGREAQMEDLQAQLDEARRDVVRTMAKLQTMATRAEAASAMAEAELAVNSLRKLPGAQAIPEATQGAGLLQQSTDEFNRQNFGGAMYLANKAKDVAGEGKGRLAAGDREMLNGEVQFIAPVSLMTTSRGNLRGGPGTRFTVLTTLDSGAGLTGYSYVDDWVRVKDESGRDGWIFADIVTRRKVSQ
jgi:Bacterial SH3 domain